MKLTSAGGLIALLDEPVNDLKEVALHKINQIIDEFWPEVAESVVKIEILHEDDTFAQRELAALIASKIYYHLGHFEDALTYALGAGKYFDVNSSSEFVQTIVAKCIDFYATQSVANFDGATTAKPIDPRLEGIVNKMFDYCLADGQYKQAIGIALETRRMDVFERAIKESGDIPGMLSYALKVTMGLIQNRTFRNEILRSLVRLYQGLATPDYINMVQCLIFLDDSLLVAGTLEKLILSNEADVLMAEQICFDLYESATQQFVTRVINTLKGTTPATAESTDVEKVATEDTAMDTDAQSPPRKKKFDEEGYNKRLENLTNILSGDTAIDLHLQFLIRNNHTDLNILKKTKDTVRVSVCHSATVIAHGLMNAGTTSDSFLRDNLDWLSRATNWAKLTATASLGAIHRGHEKDAKTLMSSYLPKDSGLGGAGYTEGGALYALGLIHANHGSGIVDYLLSQLKDAPNEVVRHGGCLGLGLAGIGSQRSDIYELLRNNLYQDDAVVGEAAGIAMGLTMLGSADTQAVQDMVAYAQETQHEKILRGLALGISLIMYGRLEEADGLILQLSGDKDPILRRAAMFTIGVAYAGTGSNQAVKKLLHFAVSDVNDDVRRAAVTAIGFLLFRTPEQCPSVVSLLAESYNPHVRYGAAMALGVACAGTGLKEAVNLLETLANDPVNYVRQGALIASALVLIQQTEYTSPKVKDFRQLYAKVIGDKHEDVMAKFGAIIAQGIIDGGGRNATISLQSRTGHTSLMGVVGLMVFCQYWYWYPLALCLTLAFTPSCLVALNSDLKMPKIAFKSNAKPSMFAPPPPLEEKKREERERVSTAVLSITARAKKREAAKTDKMDVDEEKKDEIEKEKKAKEEAETAAAKKEEPAFEILQNPARIMRQQLKLIQFEEGTMYSPLKDLSIGGIILVKRVDGTEATEEIVEPVPTLNVVRPEEEVEPEAPEAFEYKED
ncbi:26S proteasome non-ATPase regulatory subunit 1-like isoform X2 [Artemia franciscana]|uniref:26S proteasome non-ATPase regulatory subunit 1 n=1 Tax=Artemia franciscana TaxID=6661 RepID=A0AA88I0Y8_ARTSF|nr:hypothetical protein QYM36_004961 [Artemia franciscana]